MGKEVFHTSLNDPDMLIEYVRKSEDGYCYLEDGGPSSSWPLITELHERSKISKEEFNHYEKEIDKINQLPLKDTNCWQKHSDLKTMFPNLAEYVIERDGPDSFDD